MKRESQLGMNPSTASHRLVKDTLFRLAVEAGHVCHHCKKPLDMDSFSVEHVTPWLNSPDTTRLFFDQNNIAFSHLSCNSAAGGKGAVRRFSPEEAEARVRLSKKRHWTAERRRDKYLRLGT